MKIMAIPRDSNPYQELLYSEMRSLGDTVTYIGELTPVRTLSLLLLPVEVAARRLAGARVVHIHWVFGFALPGPRSQVMRRLAQWWFLVWLRTCRVLGVRLVWTAHNVLPHEPVFADDVTARRKLVAASDLVLAHSQAALLELTQLGAVPRKAAVVPHGPLGAVTSAGPLRLPGADGGARRFLFFGQVRDYKGVDDLLAVFSAMPDSFPAELTVAGQCDEPSLRSRLQVLADRCGTRAVLRLERVADDELADLLSATDVVVLPYRRVTTSGSAMLALHHGRPLILPDVAALAEIPDEAAVRYSSPEQLGAAMEYLTRADAATLAAMSAAGRSFASRTTWADIANATRSEMRGLLGSDPHAGARSEESAEDPLTPDKVPGLGEAV